MRNIALLEWGPASLFYILPRQKIKVRTEWLEGGPVLPHFLEADSAGGSKGGDLNVRYALSAFEDLNGTIKNLRLCFGFPYSEYIGYLNTLTGVHRARREHEACIERLRRWATFNNIDAIVWIDYAKSNQPPGSFKVGQHSSCPFSKAQIQVCSSVSDLKRRPNQDEESDPPWSDADDDLHHMEHTLAKLGAGTSSQGAPATATTSMSISEHLRRFRQQQSAPRAPPPRRAGQPPAPQQRTPRRSAMHPDGASGSGTPREAGGSVVSERAAGAGEGATQRAVFLPPHERAMQGMLQEEVIPAYGSIYPRTLTPGPGYYGVPDAGAREAASFRSRPKGCIDVAVDEHRAVPAPGIYEPAAAMTSVKKPLGSFDKAYLSTLMTPAQTMRRLPFISTTASLTEAPGVHSPGRFHSVGPEAMNRTGTHSGGSSWSFGKLRRPFS